MFFFAVLLGATDLESVVKLSVGEYTKISYMPAVHIRALYSHCHKRQRLTRVRRHLNWACQRWDYYLFSYESWFHLATPGNGGGDTNGLHHLVSRELTGRVFVML